MPIICHIVGMNNAMRREFMKDMKDTNIKVIDLDELSYKINKLPEIKKLKHKKSWGTNLKIGSLWKHHMNEKLEKIGKKANVILLGLSTYAYDHRIKLNIDTSNKYFINIDSNKNAKKIIEFNLDHYRKHIINGHFPLRYLDHDYLDDQRTKIQKTYKSMGYNLKSPTVIKRWVNNRKTTKISKKKSLSNFEQDAGYKSNVMYIGSKVSHDKVIKNRKVIRRSKRRMCEFFDKEKAQLNGYAEKWLAIISSIDNVNNYVRKGFLKKRDKMIPFIQEKYEGAFAHLDDSCYLYTVPQGYFGKKSKYRAKASNELHILNKKRVSNIFDEIRRNGIRTFNYGDKLKQ